MVLRTSVVVILVMLATIAYAETSGATGPDQLQEKEAQVTALSSAHAKAVQDFMAIVEPGGSFGAVERMADEAKGGANGRGAARLKLQDANSDEWTYIDVDNDTGTIYSYIAANMWCDSTYGIHMPEEFAASEIFERAVPVLSHYGLSVDIRDYRIGRMSEVEPWYVERELRHKGIVCRGSRIEILLAPTSGRIDSVFYQPVRIPDEREEKPRVTKLEALARAEEWFRGHKFVGEYEVVADARSLSKISRVIALPNTFYGAIDRPEIKYPAVAHYCWEVPFRWTEYRGTEFQNTGRGRLWISTYDGSIVGGATP